MIQWTTYEIWNRDGPLEHSIIIKGISGGFHLKALLSWNLMLINAQITSTQRAGVVRKTHLSKATYSRGKDIYACVSS